VILKQILQVPVADLSSLKALASCPLRSSGARNKKNASREAVLGPIPGSRESALIKFCSGAGKIAMIFELD
jgi:hypothetical protein